MRMFKWWLQWCWVDDSNDDDNDEDNDNDDEDNGNNNEDSDDDDDSDGKSLRRFDPDCCSSCPSPVSDYTQPTPSYPLLCYTLLYPPLLTSNLPTLCSDILYSTPLTNPPLSCSVSTSPSAVNCTFQSVIQPPLLSTQQFWLHSAHPLEFTKVLHMKYCLPRYLQMEN